MGTALDLRMDAHQAFCEHMGAKMFERHGTFAAAHAAYLEDPRVVAFKAFVDARQGDPVFTKIYVNMLEQEPFEE